MVVYNGQGNAHLAATLALITGAALTTLPYLNIYYKITPES